MTVVFRAADPELAHLRQVVFDRYPDEEWATFFRCGWHESQRGLVLTLARVDSPSPGELDASVPHVAIQEPYSLRIALEAEGHSLGIGIVHSHPQDYIPRPSPIDDDMDRYYADYFGGFAPNRPYVSLIFAQYLGDLVVSGRVFWRGRWVVVTRAVFERAPIRTWVGGKTPERDPAPRGRTARLSAAFGDEAEARLARSVVAVIGAGGTGSAAIEVLARAGVGRLVLVDPDVFEDSNLERVHGSTSQDSRRARPKVAIARDHVRSIAPDCQVEAFVGRLPQQEIVNAILEADLAIGCTDSQHSRLALSDTALRYLLPALDCGVALEGEGGTVTGQIGQITRFLAADPCALCRQMITQRRLDQELMAPSDREARQREAARALERGDPPDPYWFAEPQLNTVGYHTTLIGAMTAGYAIGWITGRFDSPFTKLQFNLVARFLDVTDADFDPRPSCHCRVARGWADQGARYALIAPPSHWPPPKAI
jgi:molybdopterin/thiamine biosynthesis adenylyltransferase